jgi:hypothetical protein
MADEVAETKLRILREAIRSNIEVVRRDRVKPKESLKRTTLVWLWGFLLIELVTEAKIPFDFIVHDSGSTSLVRVRRLKHHGYGAEIIGRSCADQIREFRELVLPAGVGRELWVRGPERAWHRCRVLLDTVEVIPDIPQTGLLTAGEKGKGE